MRKPASRSLREAGPQRLLKIAFKLTPRPLLLPDPPPPLPGAAGPASWLPPHLSPHPELAPALPCPQPPGAPPPQDHPRRSHGCLLPHPPGHALRLPVGSARLKALPPARPPPLVARATHSGPHPAAGSHPLPPRAPRLPNGQHYSPGKGLRTKPGAATLKTPAGFSPGTQG